MIDSNKIHFVKCSIRNWNGEVPRLKINMDVVGITNNKIIPLQWKMTQEKRELQNSLGDDANWSGYQTALAAWQQIRDENGHGVKLWIGKLHDRLRYKKGVVQHAERIEYAVSLLILDRQKQTLVQQLWWEDFDYVAEFHDIESADYNRIWDFRNPLSSKIGSTRSRRVSL